MLCKNCNEDRDERYFRTRTIKGKLYYKRHKCKICLSPLGEDFKSYGEKVRKVNTLSDECKYLIHKIDLRNGEVDVIDAYKLASFYIDVFDIYQDDIPVQQDLLNMFNQLKALM